MQPTSIVAYSVAYSDVNFGPLITVGLCRDICTASAIVSFYPDSVQVLSIINICQLGCLPPWSAEIAATSGKTGVVLLLPSLQADGFLVRASCRNRPMLLPSCSGDDSVSALHQQSTYIQARVIFHR